MTGVDAKIDAEQAASALSDIDDIARRVRQSTIYQIAGLMLLAWGSLVFAGNMASYLWPAKAGYIWIAANLAGSVASCVISVIARRSRMRRFDPRAIAALVLFFAFGLLWSIGLGQFGPRQLGVFWTTYFMMVYTIVGLWVGPAFVTIGLGITGLTLIGYVFVRDGLDLWMAVVNGGGLFLGGLWMRRD